MNPFQTPSTNEGITEQMRNLHRGLERFSTLSQLGEDATGEEVRSRVNELTALLTQLTRREDIRRR